MSFLHFDGVFRHAVSVLLILSISGCVSIPDRMLLVAMDVDRGPTQHQASCIYGDAEVAWPVGSRSGYMLDAHRISLVNWNMYKARGEGWAVDFNRLIQGQDIVVLQEAILLKKLYQPLNSRELNWSLNAAFHYDDAQVGTLTASRARPVRSCGLRASEPLIRIPKTVLISEYRLSHGRGNLLVVNIHGINFTLGTQSYQQQIDAMFEAIRHHAGPLIVAGDFNTWSDERMDIVNKMAERLSLMAVEYRSHHRMTLFGNPLDHIFYRGLKLVSEESPRVSSSDHNPIKVIFSALPAKFARVKS